jgi:phosphoribosylformylglycinamidine cyclo-ligase
MEIKGLSHITGGGIIGNTKRIIPAGLSLNISWDNWEIPLIFRIIQEAGKISNDEMRKVFNLGIGLIAVINKNNKNEIIKLSAQVNETPVFIGEVVSS